LKPFKIIKMKRVTLLGYSIAFILISYSSAVLSQDWPQWRGELRDSKVTGFKAPASWPAELKQAWKVTVGTGDATPVLSKGKIYMNTRQGENEVVLCLNAEDGKEVWKNVYPASPVTGPAGSHPGPRSTPVVSDGKVITFGATAILSCFDAVSGKLLWRKENPENEVPQFFTGMSPLVADRVCYAHIGTKDKGKIIALELNSGKEKWTLEGDGPAYASPSMMNFGGRNTLVVQTEKNLMALNPADGKILWQYSTPVQQRFYNCVSPYIDGQIIYLSGQGTGTKALKIDKKGNEYSVSEIWNNPAVGSKWNTPVLNNGFLFGFSDQKRLYCINASSGVTAWIDNTVNSDFSTIVDCGSIILGLASTGNLIVLKPDPAAYNEIARYKVSETPVYAYPVISGNNIFVKDAETLTLFKVN
jgi:outer membrane protein assembly factor BamB